MVLRRCDTGAEVYTPYDALTPLGFGFVGQIVVRGPRRPSRRLRAGGPTTKLHPASAVSAQGTLATLHLRCVLRPFLAQSSLGLATSRRSYCSACRPLRAPRRRIARAVERRRAHPCGALAATAASRALLSVARPRSQAPCNHFERGAREHGIAVSEILLDVAQHTADIAAMAGASEEHVDAALALLVRSASASTDHGFARSPTRDRKQRHKRESTVRVSSSSSHLSLLGDFMETIATVHHAEEIVRLLVQGLSPITDNRDALLEQGFERLHPCATAKCERSIWERLVARKYHDARSYHHRVFVRERAFLKE